MDLTLKQLREELKYEKTNKCVQCGYCIPVCPTYTTFKKETHSPRGRINLVKMVGEGRISELSVLEESFNLCLGCRACESACPTGVDYGSILESVRVALEKRNSAFVPKRLLQRVILRKVVPSRKMMNLAGHTFWLYEKSKLQKAVRFSGIRKVIPNKMGTFESVIPQSVPPKERRNLSKGISAKKEAKYTVAFFVGCVMDAMFHRINQLSIKLLSEVGCNVIVVQNQTCCGALHAHAGDIDEARRLAKENISAFEQVNADFIVNNAGGCGAMLYEYGHLLEADHEWVERAIKFSNKSRDISQIIFACGGLPKSVFRNNERVTYQPSCHMTNVQKVKNEPIELIKAIPGINFIEMEQADACCGSAGIYNIVNYEASMRILDEKMKHAKATEATTIITTNPGCLLQMKIGIEREGFSQSMRALHLIEYLAEVYGIT